MSSQNEEPTKTSHHEPGREHEGDHDLWDGLETIGAAITHYSGQERMLHKVLEVLEWDMGFRRSTVMLLSPDGGELRVEAAQEGSAVATPGAWYARGEGITGQVLQSGRPAMVARISEEPGFKNRVHRRGEQQQEDCSFICVPVLTGDEAVGTLAVDLECSSAERLEACRRFLSVVASLIASDVHARRQAEIQKRLLEDENQRLRGELEGVYRPENIIGNSHAMRLVYQRINQVAGSETTVLIRGESGTGKELVASAIHYSSPRAKRPFVRVNCAALNEALIESELFGHEKGAFTGALHERIGRIAQAEGGTLFLDEIGDFSPVVQVKLLRVIQERQYERVGGNEVRQADVRILAATNRDLEEDVRSGRFRNDLYYRINVFPVFLPPLRERREDILQLADHFVAQYSAAMNKNVRRISTSAINMMMAYHWPGNVRELQNCIEHAVLLSTEGVIRGSHLPPTLQMPDAAEGSQPPGLYRLRLEQLERDLLSDALKRHGGCVASAAKEIGITERMVRYKIKKLHIDHRQFTAR